jgi:hypothetical protein
MGSSSGEHPEVRVDIPSGNGVLVGGHGTQHNTFVRNYVAVQSAAVLASSADGPVVAGDVPLEPAAFQPRPDLMEVLQMATGHRVSVVHAVTGMRGVGKTQLAAAYARRRIAEGWRLVAWVDASNMASVLAGLAQVAAVAGVGSADEDARVLAKGLRHWLEADGDRRLLIFDNAADLDGLRPFLPAAGAGQVVITSSRRPAAALGTGVAVDVFTEEEALAFLVRRTGLADEAGARELAEELGRLPLGLAQAAALIAGQHLGYRTYLERLRAMPVRPVPGSGRGGCVPASSRGGDCAVAARHGGG